MRALELASVFYSATYAWWLLFHRTEAFRRLRLSTTRTTSDLAYEHARMVADQMLSETWRRERQLATLRARGMKESPMSHMHVECVHVVATLAVDRFLGRDLNPEPCQAVRDVADLYGKHLEVFEIAHKAHLWVCELLGDVEPDTVIAIVREIFP